MQNCLKSSLALVLFLVLPNIQAQQDDPIDPRPFYFGERVDVRGRFDNLQFLNGFKLFTKTFSVKDGLGPSFSGASCSHCHRDPLPGGSGSRPDSFVTIQKDFVDEMGGHTLASKRMMKNGKIEEVTATSDSSKRRSPPLFGLGLIQGISDNTILQNADPEDKDHDGISGRVIIDDRAVGRFGVKAKLSTLEAFVGRALKIEMGISNSVSQRSEKLPSDLEITENDLRDLIGYLKMLGPPPRRESLSLHSRGASLFKELGCAQCHTPSLESVVLGQRCICHCYSDLLVHDMGSENSDGIIDNDVAPTEYRTALLWGLFSVGPPYWHDGRAKSITEAILNHGGEGNESRKKFVKLGENEQAEVIAFLKSL